MDRGGAGWTSAERVFSVLNMRSVARGSALSAPVAPEPPNPEPPSPEPPAFPPDDLTARARIRDAAILRFAREGFGASVRTIAADAGVSPGLVIHHFGSKSGLRQACDDFVTDRIRDNKQDVVGGAGGPMTFLAQMGRLDEFAPLVAYAVRSLQAGGEMARAFVDHIVADALAYIADGVAAGTIIPSRDEDARARYVVGASLGPLLVEMSVNPPDDPSDLRAVMDTYVATAGLPALELFTEGFLADRTLLDSYLDYAHGPPGPA